MEEFNQILLQVWREACRDIEIEKSCAVISSMLLKHIPLDQVLIRDIEDKKKYLETIAVGFHDSVTGLTQAVSHYAPREWKKLIDFCKQKSILHRLGHTPDDERINLMITDPDNRDVLIGPLEKENRLLGVLIFVSQENVLFTGAHKQMMEILLEPFSIALENDLKIREINVLREAAEADKNSLLQRLSRKALADTIVGKESGLKQVMERIHLVARSDVPVVIFGETGTGKELVAREIHRMSPRSDNPFIRVNCGSIPPELIDSQLFGHEKGAFTGAVSTHKGWFERANSGTLFLDEIGELPLAGQVRLLRIIQDGWLERVGGKMPIYVDVRLVIATHRDLVEMVKTGQFREDLWYRLSVFPILLPSLRDRIEDIETLANHFAERAAIRFSLPLQLPSRNDIELLCTYSWPGNIRELGSVIDRAAILGNGQGLKIAPALGWTRDGTFPMHPPDDLSPINQTETFPSLDLLVKKHIEQALIHTKGRVEGVKGAAKLLHVNPNTLRARMRKLNIDWKKFRETV